MRTADCVRFDFNSHIPRYRRNFFALDTPPLSARLPVAYPALRPGRITRKPWPPVRERQTCLQYPY